MYIYILLPGGVAERAQGGAGQGRAGQGKAKARQRQGFLSVSAWGDDSIRGKKKKKKESGRLKKRAKMVRPHLYPSIKKYI